ncbi:abortive infection family protein [Cytobacillus firmus]|uniref:abortive infection family protein n=1 Tax=Cytobacillus firmus TaxID=1399 RepID=UPI0024C146EF|nr:abortive infection family protein [Cytobacillus firmus]WHY63657.1 abortive infection family protein [Cytobacillus firmus]
MSAIETLEKVKSEITSYINGSSSQFIDNESFRKARIIIKRISQEQNLEVPSFITACRTVEETVDELYSDGAPDFVQVNYVNLSFNKYIDFLEEQQLDVKIVHVEAEVPEELKFEYILESIEKCENRINSGDYSGAVTSAKTLVEGVCKEILNKFADITIDNKTDLPALFTKVRQNLNLDPRDPDLDKALKEVLTGLIKIVNGISEIRNKRGDSHIPTYKIDRHHALIVVNSAKTVVTFLFNTYEYQLKKGSVIL